MGSSVAVVAIATVPIVLGRVVVWCVGWCHWSGGRIQANYAATFARAIQKYLDRSSNEAVRASEVLQESCLSELLHVAVIEVHRNAINRSSHCSRRHI